MLGVIISYRYVKELCEGRCIKVLNQSSLDTVIGSGGLASAIRKMEEDRQVWAQSLQPMSFIAEKLTEPSSYAVQMTKQLHNMEWQRAESIRTMFDPIADIRKSLMMDSGVSMMLEDFARPMFLSNELAKMAKEASGFGSAIKAMQESMQASLVHAQQTIAASSISSTFCQVMKTYEEAQKFWTVPSGLIESVGALKAMQDQIGRLTLPVMDWNSAATLAMMLGPEGIEAQLEALGIGLDGTITEEGLQGDAQGIGLSRKTLELMTLLSFILAILIPIYQHISSRESQHQTDKKFDAQEQLLKVQARKLEALSLLVEKAFEREAKRIDERFVVLDRVATVRVKPKHGSTVVGNLLPRETVKPIAAQGKWIQIEYYHWLRQEYQTGWVLKKYFKRVPASYRQFGGQHTELCSPSCLE